MNKDIREVTIPAIVEHDGIHSITVKLLWRCPVCGMPRGEVFPAKSYDGSRVLEVDGWHNPCGHVDKYSAVREEAASNGLNEPPGAVEQDDNLDNEEGLDSFSRKLRKEKALSIMRQMQLLPDYIEMFENEKVCIFESFYGYGVDQFPELKQKIRELECKHKCLVYAVTHDNTSFGELYDFLIVPKHEEDWEHFPRSEGSRHIVYAYVWNTTREECSEFGSVLIQAFHGGIARIV